MQGTQLLMPLDLPPRLTPATAPVRPEPPELSGGKPPVSAPVAIASGEKAKARDILAAIRVLKSIEREQRAATPEERKTLARFGGFGPVALSIFPHPISGGYKDTGWWKLGQELKELITPEEYDSAKRTTFNAFYTSSTVIRGMYQAMKRLGVPENALALEPGCGPGRFLYLAPETMRFIGVELDSISGRIARALHPGQDIRIENFRDTRLPEIDAVIGNVPFADKPKLDHKGQRYSLHDYFFAKSIDALRPGGVLALVTSHFTLDKINAAIREYLAERADFLGAIRLPSDAFQREGTSVVTDIVFLRKRSTSEQANHADPEWLQVAPLSIDGAEVTVNKYFVNNPDMVLGTWSREKTLYGSEGYSVKSNGELAEQLQAAIRHLPEYAPQEAVAPETPRPAAFTPPPPLPHLSEGSFFISDDRFIQQIVDGQAQPVIYRGKKLHERGDLMGRRMAALIRMKEQARRVLDSQNDGWPEAAREAERRELRSRHDRFVFTYGPINHTTFGETADGSLIRRMPNLVKFREDPDAMLVMALEEYDEATGKATKAPIMSKDVVGRQAPITRVASAEEGLLVSLDRRGGVDLAYISGLYGKPEESVIDELADLIYRDPETKAWHTADDYLSGNVRAKLAQAEAAGPQYQRNAEALRAVQPEDVLPGEIDANLGAPWIPENDIRDFAAYLFQVDPKTIQVSHIAKDAVWSIDCGYSAQQSVAATADYGTQRANATWLLELALNMKTPTIYDPDPDDKDRRIVNQEQTLAAREKQKRIKERFKSWLFSDPDRAERLVRIYNDNFNNLRPRLFDGSHLDFPGMSQAFQLRQHQKDAVWRGMSSGTTLLAHCVGAGKTAICAATGMKMKQAGLIKKPMYVVPNHLLEQFAREFMHVYPNAKLLVAAKEDFTRERRKILTAKIASGDWDGIIVTHSSFERIGMSREYQEQFLNEQIKEYEDLIIEHAADKGGNRNILKTLEKQKAAREEKLKDLLAEEKKDDGLVFDELGVDHIFVDEFQYFKNLEAPTKMDRVAGIQTGGSERAFDMYLKTRHLHQKHPRHGVTAATGTPISNSLVEMYTMQRYLDPQGLTARGIDHFDAWAANFGEVVESMEISPDGKTLKPRSRFAKFVNLPELQQMFRAFADVQTAEMLNLPRPRLESAKPIVIACPMSEEQHAIQDELVARYERIRNGGVDPREDNALKITTDGRKLALDARMLSPDAQDEPASKINTMVEHIAAIWRKSQAKRGTQMVFCDMGVHPTPWGYSAYEDIIGKLTAAGIPRNEIACIGEADSDAKKRVLFEKMRNGQVRVLIGSTTKMGTGTNVQKRLMALHHLDAPWKPAEVEQREGRIIRQGNENEEVSIYRYVTTGSFDSYMWQTLEVKAKFINQIMRGDTVGRQAEDIGSQELDYATVKALASGNPAFMTLAEADAEIQKLSILQRNHGDEQYLIRRRLRDLPDDIKHLQKRTEALEKDMAALQAHPDHSITLGNRTLHGDEAVIALSDRLDTLPLTVSESRYIDLGTYRGLKFGVVLHALGGSQIYLQGDAVRHGDIRRDARGLALLNALKRLADGYENEAEATQQRLTVAESQLRDYKARQGAGFSHETYLKELSALRDDLRKALSGFEAKEGETAADIAAKIKALRAEHTVEAAPEREVRAITAEEPVTARIRRRAEELAAGSQAPAASINPEGEIGHEAGQDAAWQRKIAVEAMAETQRMTELG